MKEEKATQAASPDAAAEIQATAAQERSRILGIQSALAGAEFKAVSDRAIAEGWDLKTAKAEAFDIAQAARKTDAAKASEVLAKETEAKAQLQQRLDAIANSGHAEELKGQDDTTATNPLAKTNSADGSAENFETAIKAQINAGQTKANAIAKAARQNPADHKAWIASKQKK